MNIIKIGIALVLFSISLNSFSQPRIEQSKKELKEGAKKDTKSDDNDTKSDHDEDDSSSSFFDEDEVNTEGSNNLLAEIISSIVFYSYFGDYASEEHLYNRLTRYPYYHKFCGNYESPDPDSSATKKMRLDLEDKFLLSSSNLFGNHLKAKIRPSRSFYLQADYFQLMEIYTDRSHESYSHLSLFNFDFCYDRIRLEQFNIGWTLGANYVANDVKKGGISLGLNTEAFIEPFSLYSSMKWGLVNQIRVNELEISGKYHQKKYFFSMGYERLRIATPKYHFISAGLGIYL